MKNKHLFSTAILSALVFLVAPLKANHLDGLWRNDRQNITIRIETLDDGFRAKRIDQGIWYRYFPQDNSIFTDRLGNAYVLQSENELVWNEANSGRRIHFSKIENRRDDRWEYRYDRNDHGYRNDDFDHYSWDRPGHHDLNSSISGRWIDTYQHSGIEIECFKDGIRVRRAHEGWEKYYPDKYGHGFNDRYGNKIRLIDSNTIGWESQHGRHGRIYHRASGYRKENCY